MQSALASPSIFGAIRLGGVLRGLIFGSLGAAAVWLLVFLLVGVPLLLLSRWIDRTIALELAIAIGAGSGWIGFLPLALDRASGCRLVVREDAIEIRTVFLRRHLTPERILSVGTYGAKKRPRINMRGEYLFTTGLFVETAEGVQTLPDAFPGETGRPAEALRKFAAIHALAFRVLHYDPGTYSTHPVVRLFSGLRGVIGAGSTGATSAPRSDSGLRREPTYNRVAARWNDGFWYPATEMGGTGDNARVRFSDGSEGESSRADVRNLRVEPGGRAEAHVQGEPRYAPCELLRVDEDETVRIRYLDGREVETRVDELRWRNSQDMNRAP